MEKNTRISITLFWTGLIDLHSVAEYVAGRLFSKRRRGRHKAVRRLLRRHRDARRRQSLNSGRSILSVEQETDGHPHGGRQHRHLQPQRPSPGKAHLLSPSPRLFLCAPAAIIDTFRPALPPRPARALARSDYRASRAASKCRVTSATSSRLPRLRASFDRLRRMTSKGPDQFHLPFYVRSRTLIKRLSRERRSTQETALPFHEYNRARNFHSENTFPLLFDANNIIYYINSDDSTTCNIL